MKLTASFLFLFWWLALLAVAAPPTVLSGSLNRESVSLRINPPTEGEQTMFTRKAVIVESGGDLAILQLPPRRGTALAAFVVRGLKRQSDLGRKAHVVTHLNGVGKLDLQSANGGHFSSTATVITRLDGDLVKPRLQAQGTVLVQDEWNPAWLSPDVTPMPMRISPGLLPFFGHSSQTLRFRGLLDAKLTALVASAPSFDEAVQILEKKLLQVEDPILFTSLREWAVPAP